MNHHQKIHRKLDSFYKSERIPHIIFYGQPGTGKKTIVNAFMKKIYVNEEILHTNVMYVNCAHGKGIKFIREELKFFAKTNTQLNHGITFKSVVLLNAEHLTVDAQSALRRCIEQFSAKTRFFIVITNKYKLLFPILSRFCEIYVPPLIDKSENYISLHNVNPTKDSVFWEKRKTRLDEMMETMEETDADLLRISCELYEEAFSAIDLMSWIKTKKRWTPFEQANIGMCFMKIKSEFRCEKLLILFMLNFIFFHSLEDINSLSFM